MTQIVFSIKIQVLLIGSATSLEFRHAFQWLREHVQLTHAADLLEAVSILCDDVDSPKVIILAQSRPGQYSAKNVEQLRRLAPLARMVTLLGSWCEGEARSGKPLSGCLRTYWHQWPHRGACEIKKLADNDCLSWGLPLTASEDERVEHLSAGFSRQPHRQGLIALATQTTDSAEILSEVLLSTGYATAILTPQSEDFFRGISAVIFDGFGREDADIKELERLKKLYPAAPLIVLANFPRREYRDLALQAGATCVISKPFLLDDLFWQLDQALGQESPGFAQPAASLL